MLELKDLIHLPELVPFFDRLAAESEGLIVVAGLDPPPVPATGMHRPFLPSGRTAVSRMLMHRILMDRPGSRAAAVSASEPPMRLPRGLRRRVQSLVVSPTLSWAEAINQAVTRRPELLVVDSLTADSATAALEAAANGQLVLAKCDTALRGPALARHLGDLGVPKQWLRGLAWVVSVRRLATLCPQCREPACDAEARLAEVVPQLARHASRQPASGEFFRAVGCPQCRGTGRAGEVSVFDVYRAATPGGKPSRGNRLSLHCYLFGLVRQGHLSLDDLLGDSIDDLRLTNQRLLAAERALAEIRVQARRLQAELEAANQVLQHRTEALVSLESIGQALSASPNLDELAARLCRHARDLCGADRSILYHLRVDEGRAEVLAESGWDPALLRQPIDADLVLGDHSSSEPVACDQWPPGVPRRATDVTGRALRAGLRVPLVTEDGHVGLMIVHTGQKGRFAPGEVALLKTFASQAAVAIQRASLMDRLQEKLVQLSAAQAELVQKELMEQELQLARQVQQSVLPDVFPRVPGYEFAARSAPARWVGGDFYDLLRLDDQRLGIVVGDVSGKGMPAALFMARAHSLLVAEAYREPSPRRVLANVHSLLRSLSRSSMFVTVFYGILDAEQRRFTYARAGHDRPLLVREGSIEELGGQGTVLGFPDMDELYLSEELVDLSPGDRLVLFTDGLADAQDAAGQPLGHSDLVSLILDHGELSPDALVEATFADVLAHQGRVEQFDDMTMLVMSVSAQRSEGAGEKE